MNIPTREKVSEIQTNLRKALITDAWIHICINLASGVTKFLMKQGLTEDLYREAFEDHRLEAADAGWIDIKIYNDPYRPSLIVELI